MSPMDCWRNLAAAVIERAVRDREEALERLQTNPSDRIALGTVAEVELFMATEWASQLVWFCPERERTEYFKEVGE